MSRYSGNFTDNRSGDDDLVEDLKQQLSKAERLRHLYDVFQGNANSPSWYYSQAKSTISNPSKWASKIAAEHSDEAEQFLNRRDNEFSKRKLKTNALIDFLAERGVSREFIDEYSPTSEVFLILVYQVLYDVQDREIYGYELLLAKCRLFRYRNNHTYQFTEMDLDDLDARIETFVRNYNRGNTRPLSANTYELEEENEFIVDLYREVARVSERVFDIRDTGEKESNPLSPRVTYRKTYKITNISLNFAQEDDGCRVILSDKLSGWNKVLKPLFSDLFNIEEPFTSERKKRSERVDDVLSAAQQTLTEDESTDTDLTESVESEIQSLSEMVRDSAADTDELPFEDMDEIYDSIELVGVSVEGSQESDTDTFKISSKVPLEDWANKNTVRSDSLKEILSDTDKTSLQLILRGKLRGGEGEIERFVLEDGTWKADGGVLSEEGAEVLNILFNND